MPRLAGWGLARPIVARTMHRVSMPAVAPKPPRILPPEIPVLVLGTRHAVWLSADGEIDTIDIKTAARRARDEAPLLAHGRAAARRLDLRDLRAFDALELFAFTCPGQFCLPTPRGLMTTLGLGRAGTLEDQAMGLADAVPIL